jgi:hypothetical protein
MLVAFRYVYSNTVLILEQDLSLRRSSGTELLSLPAERFAYFTPNT